MHTDLFGDDRKGMWRWRGWGWDGRLGRKGGGGVGGVCVRLHGLGSVGWGWRIKGLD